MSVAPERSWVRRLPTPVWTMALIYGVGGAMCLFAAAFPISSTAPTTLGFALGSLLLLVAAVLIWLGPALPAAVPPVLAAAGTLFNSVLVAAATTDYGATLTTFAYIWIAIYAGQFFAPRVVRLQCGLIAAASGAAFAINGISGALTAWVLVVVSVAVAGETLSRINARLRAQIETDSLTGLRNRTGLAPAAERVFALAQRSGKPTSVALIDLDGFKQVNDREGHAAGDALLAGLGRDWLAQLRRSEVLARLGGDEFVLVLPGADAAGSAEALARLRAASPIGWSAGVVEWGRDESLEEALVRADEALYREKAQLLAVAG